ncbi:MAG: RHS repeat-associated core domain-containing protein, partial [Sphingobacteriaceae bacterium]|nr:RHS repeat-associated core domain-containing protein [Sphingobacteriaceae bacterium]
VHQQNTAAYYTPYTFSGKERDIETGLSYFGARYYDAGLSIWLSVDPMADKYPAWSPYAYTLQNPVVLIDPTGMSAEWFETPDGQIQFDPAIKSQADLKAKGIDGKYLGAQGVGINQQTGMADMYNVDGTITPNVGTFSGPMIDISAPMTDHQRTMSNPVVQAVHRGQGEFVAGALDVMGDALNNVGTASTVVGYGASLVPGGQPLGAAFISLGSTFSAASNAVGTGSALYAGNGVDAAVNAAFGAAGNANTRIFNNLESRKVITTADRQILQTGFDLKLTIGSFMYENR